MAKGLTAPLSIINFIELAMSIIIGGLIGNMILILNDYPKLQLINAVAYGYIIINVIVVGSVILKEELPKNVRMAIAGSAVILYMACGALILESFDKNQNALKFDDEIYGRTLSAGDPELLCDMTKPAPAERFN